MEQARRILLLDLTLGKVYGGKLVEEDADAIRFYPYMSCSKR